MLKEIKILVIVLAALSTFITLSGCAGNMPEAERMDYIDANWGKSFETAKNNQILNPQAAKNLEPVEGLDGKAAENIINKYEESFKEKTDTASMVININR